MEKLENIPMISPDGKTELLNKKLEYLKAVKLTDAPGTRMHLCGVRFALAFYELCRITEDLSQKELMQLTDLEIGALEEIRIYPKAKSRAFWQALLCLSNPIGWFIGLIVFLDSFNNVGSPFNHTWHYLILRRRLLKNFGSTFSPSKVIMNNIKQNDSA